jgi:serine/threonine protein phosphatase 1
MSPSRGAPRLVGHRVEAVALTGPCDSPIYAVLRRPRRVWAVASVHGEADRLRQLHRLIEERYEKGDRLVYLGNIVGHGARLAEAVDEVLRFRARALARHNAFVGDVAILRGAQEEMWQRLLELQFAPNPREVLTFMLSLGVGATIAAYGGDPRQGEAACREGVLAITRWTNSLRQRLNQMPGHAQFMASLRRAAFTDANSVLFVHAGFDATKPLDLQGDAFWWGGLDFHELNQPYETYLRVVRGFDRQRAGLIESPYAVSIDAGCGFGGPLIAACFGPDGTMLDHVDS